MSGVQLSKYTTRGQYVYCLIIVMVRSSCVGSFHSDSGCSIGGNGLSIVCLRIAGCLNDEAARPRFVVNFVQVDFARRFIQQVADLQHEFFLMGATQDAGKSAVLDTIQTIIQTSVGDLGTAAI